MNHDFFGRGRFAVGKAGEQIGQFGFVFRVIGHVEHFGGRERAHAVIFAAIDIQHGQMAFYQGDGGQEAVAVLPLRIKLGRRIIGGGHQHHAVREQVFQQPPQNHGIGNIADVKFVKTQDARFFGNIGGNGFERVLLAVFVAHAAVDFRHEGVKVDAAFAAVGQAAEERVHQETFAAPHAAVKIQAFGHFGRAQAASQKTVALAFEHHQFVPQAVEMLDGARLGGILDKCRLLCGGLIPRFRAVVGKRGRSESLDFGHDVSRL